MAIVKLTADQLGSELKKLPEWRQDGHGNAIQRRFQFSDFAQAFAFMTQVALAAEKRDHHPEWTNVYNKVDVTLTTHDAKGVTARDLDLARYADEVFARFAG